MKNYCIISHTHWDREWYLPFENFRMRLVDLIDHLLEILEKDPNYRFHLDAQTIVLEDYLEIRPTRRALLEKYIREGRILVGPWYVQNDFHLTSGEATVRNLLIGTKIANEFGGSMPVGYAADQFGLPSQLPQILYRFGLDSCIFGRGFYRGVTQFLWETEDGSRILCEHMRAWYNNAQRFSPDPAAALELARMRGMDCLAHGVTEDCLLMNGVDHLEAQEDLGEIIDKVRPLLDEDETFFQDTLPEYVERLKKTVAEKGIRLNTYRGEFRDLGAPWVLTGTLAARSYLKTANAECQALLEKKFEPLYAGLAMLGVGNFPQEYATYMWKILIQNHPHDSICGCSVDEVHRHMLDRFARVKENANDLIDRGTTALLQHIDRRGLSDNRFLILAVNPTTCRYKGVLEAIVDIPCDEDKGSFTLTDAKGKNVPFEVVSIRENYPIRILSPINLPGGMIVNRYTVRYTADLPGTSHKTLVLTPAEGTLTVAPTRRVAPDRMENEHLRVKINRNGTVDLTHKKTGVTYSGLLLLEDNRDDGTSYNYNENDGSEIVTNENVRAKIERICDTPLKQTRRVTCSLKIDRSVGSGYVTATFDLTLRKGAGTLDVALRLENACTHHRLRLRMPTGILTDKNYAGQPYDVLVRDRVSQFQDDKTHPNTDFVGLDAPDGSHGFAVLQKGLYEYEHGTDERGTLALTVLRAFDRITGGFEETPILEEHWLTPEGECLGTYDFELALLPYAGNHEQAAVALLSQQFIGMPFTATGSVDVHKFLGGRPFVQAPGMPDFFYRPVEQAEVVVPLDATLFRLTDESVPGAMILSALKGAEAADGTQILRFYNSTSTPVTFRLRFEKALALAESVNLAETGNEPLPVRGGREMSLSAGPKQILTLRVALRGHNA